MALDRVRCKYTLTYSRYNACWWVAQGICTSCLTGSARSTCSACGARCHRYAVCRSSYWDGVCTHCREEIAHGP